MILRGGVIESPQISSIWAEIPSGPQALPLFNDRMSDVISSDAMFMFPSLDSVSGWKKGRVLLLLRGLH